MSNDNKKYLELMGGSIQELVRAGMEADRLASISRMKNGLCEVRLYADGRIETVISSGAREGRDYIVAAAFETEGDEASTPEQYDAETDLNALREFVEDKLTTCELALRGHAEEDAQS